MEKPNRALPDLPKPRNYTRAGIGITIAWFLVVGGFIYFKGSAALAALALNELGDFLGRTAGPLALAWLIIGYLQNSEELRLQRQELEFMRHEYTLQREEIQRQGDIRSNEFLDRRRAAVQSARPVR